jgi:hypothetical protein
MNPNKKNPENATYYNCDNCLFKCSKKSNYDKHISTLKHKNLTNPNSTYNKNAIKQHICNCGKIYKHCSTLSAHKKTCIILPSLIASTQIIAEDNTIIKILIDENKELINENKELMNDNKDFKKLILEMMKSNTDLQNKMLEVCKNSNNTINTNNSHNKTFNLQFFLNEQCKDAMNIMDFVNSVTLQLSDLESVGQLGYVEGITKIMIRKLTEMDIYKRPVHCSDAKREIIHVKDNDVWAKEEETYPKLRRAIKYITKKNSDLLLVWSAKYPESKNIYSKVNETYLIMLQQAMGGTGEVTENENKIIKKIAKMILIDK